MDFGPVPPDWEVVALDECCSFASGGTPSKSEPENWNGSIPWASPKDLKRAALSDTQDRISEIGLKTGSKLAPAGSVFVVVRGMILAREVPVALAAVPMAFNQDLKAVIPGDRVHSEFLVYALQTSKHQLFQKIGRSAHGTRTLLSEDLASFRLLLPPKAEQNAIAAVVGMVGRALETEERLIAVTRELKRASMQQLITRGLQGEPQKETEIGLVPESWTLGSAQRLLESLRYGTSVKCGYGDGFPVLRIPNVAGGRIVLADLKRANLSAEEVDMLRLRGGDVLFVRTNGVRERVGGTAVYHNQPENALFASYLIRARVREGAIDPDFFHYFTVSEAGRAQLSGRSSPAADGKFNINTKTIGTMVVPIPHPSEQRAIVTVLKGIDDKIVVHERKLALLRELFDTLLHDLMTGRLRVGDVDVTALDGGDDAEMPAARRDDMRVCVVDQSDNDGDDDVADRTSAERLAIMWQLTRDAWAFTAHPERAESRLQRHVVRAHRRER